MESYKTDQYRFPAERIRKIEAHHDAVPRVIQEGRPIDVEQTLLGKLTIRLGGRHGRWIDSLLRGKLRVLPRRRLPAVCVLRWLLACDTSFVMNVLALLFENGPWEVKMQRCVGLRWSTSVLVDASIVYNTQFQLLRFSIRIMELINNIVGRDRGGLCVMRPRDILSMCCRFVRRVFFVLLLFVPSKDIVPFERFCAYATFMYLSVVFGLGVSKE